MNNTKSFFISVAFVAALGIGAAYFHDTEFVRAAAIFFATIMCAVALGMVLNADHPLHQILSLGVSGIWFLSASSMTAGGSTVVGLSAVGIGSIVAIFLAAAYAQDGRPFRRYRITKTKSPEPR